MYSLETPLATLRGIGPAVTKKLNRLGIETVRDLLFYFPWKYEDFSRFTPIAEVRVGATVAVRGTLRALKERRSFRRHLTIAEGIVEDKTGAIRVMWFGQPWVSRVLKKGMEVALAGKVYERKQGAYLGSPAYEIISDTYKARNPKHEELLHVGRLIPVYPETAGLTSRWFRVWLKRFSPSFSGVPEPLPPDLLKRQKLPRIGKALRAMHFPKSLDEAHEARDRFAFENIFFLQLAFFRDRSLLERERAFPVPFDQTLAKSFVESLPWRLTDDQRKACWQILQDIARPHPMQRLLEGDVGSGKTVVAFLAVLETVKAGYQAALLAPTEILAKQHAETAQKLLGSFRTTIALLTSSEATIVGNEKRKTRTAVLEMLQRGEIDMVIGTHALLQKNVRFPSLALAVIDEQHRFGVRERARLRTVSAGGQVPHLLSMSATPIPRTLALTVYGDLEISRLEEMPAGRRPVTTEVIPPEHRKEAYGFMRGEIQKGRQAFVICPRIDPPQRADQHGYGTRIGAETIRVRPRGNPRTSALLWETKAVKEEYEKLSKKIFPDLRTGMLHGKMKPKEKEHVMEKFVEGNTDILVSTSVVEVGVDVPNATVMAIEGADRFGLASLHQFRGRVGRGSHQSYCLLFSDSAGEISNARLRALIYAKNGFELAEKDLALRGPGEFLGEEQSGMPDIAMDALKDRGLVEAARQEARLILERDPALVAWPLLAERLEKFHKKLHPE